MYLLDFQKISALIMKNYSFQFVPQATIIGELIVS